jgi:FkbM family methyltransferase
MHDHYKRIVEEKNIKIKGLINLGSHTFNEKWCWLGMGIENFILVEPQKEKFDIIKKESTGLNAILINAAVSNYNGKAVLYCDETNQGLSSSLLKPKKHLDIYPWCEFTKTEEVNVIRLDSIKFNRANYNAMYIDVQGGELEALKGCGDILNDIDVIGTELNVIEMYEDCALVNEIDEYLASFNFKRIHTVGEEKWGQLDGIYIKENLL